MRRSVTNGSIEQLRGHLGRARQNGLSETELKEMIIHLAFYAGWPRAMSAITLAKQLFTERPDGWRGGSRASGLGLPGAGTCDQAG